MSRYQRAILLQIFTAAMSLVLRLSGDPGSDAFAAAALVIWALKPGEDQ